MIRESDKWFAAGRGSKSVTSFRILVAKMKQSADKPTDKESLTVQDNKTLKRLTIGEAWQLISKDYPPEFQHEIIETVQSVLELLLRFKKTDQPQQPTAREILK